MRATLPLPAQRSASAFPGQVALGAPPRVEPVAARPVPLHSFAVGAFGGCHGFAPPPAVHPPLANVGCAGSRPGSLGPGAAPPVVSSQHGCEQAAAAVRSVSPAVRRLVTPRGSIQTSATPGSPVAPVTVATAASPSTSAAQVVAHAASQQVLHVTPSSFSQAQSSTQAFATNASWPTLPACEALSPAAGGQVSRREASLSPARDETPPLATPPLPEVGASGASSTTVAPAPGSTGSTATIGPVPRAREAGATAPQRASQGSQSAARLRAAPPPKKEPLRSRVGSSPRGGEQRGRAASAGAGGGRRGDHGLDTSGQGNSSRADLGGPCHSYSPRDDRPGHSPVRRNGSQADISQDAGGPRRTPYTARRDGASARRDDGEGPESATVRNLRRELEELRGDNARLQDKLSKARNLINLLQRQSDEARAERDKEHRRAEGLQLSAQQLQRQLKRETARAHLLERNYSAAAARSGEAVAAAAAAAVAGTPQRSPTDVEANLLSGERGRSFSTATLAPAQERRDSLGLATADGAGAAADPGIADVSSASLAPSAEGGACAGEAAAGSSGSGMERSWEFVVQGQHHVGGDDVDFGPKSVTCFPDDAVDRALGRGVVSSCSRGRRMDSGVPNQDDFLIARHTLPNDGHIALYGVFDGHGPAGHHCAAFARGSLPEFLFGQPELLHHPEETLRKAFAETQQNLLQQSFDTTTSGTTVALAMVLNLLGPSQDTDGSAGGRENYEAWLFVAHVGDSRILLASRREDESSDFSVTALTRDHRPDDNEEAERVCQQGGDIRKLHRNSGAVRVFARGQDSPGLALTRTLGASSAASCGVSAEPEIAAYQLRLGMDVLLLLGTDGLFEFCDHTDAVGKLLKYGCTPRVLEDICVESRQQWARSSYNDTVDDITAIAAMLPSAQQSSARQGLATSTDPARGG